MGIIKAPLNNWRRNAAYNEILQYSFSDYFNSFGVPYYKAKGISCANFYRETDLRTFQKSLRSDKRVRLITNKDDFILSPKDISWMSSTFGNSRMTLFPTGGHVGNITAPHIKKSILSALEGLK